MNGINCGEILQRHRRDVEELIRVQKEEHREAIFFIFDGGSTSDVFKGDHTSISLSKDQEKEIRSQGNIKASVHTHPSGFDPSTIDIMTGLMTEQEFMCVATPALTEEGEDDFVLTCVELGALDAIQSQRLLRAMRRSTVGVTDLGRLVRKNTNLKRFEVRGCRSQPIREKTDQNIATLAQSGKEFIGL